MDRIINDTINNFSIDTDYGLYIEEGDYHSYTFKITRPNGSNYLLENVVVSKKNETEYETILYQYNITEQELDMIDNGDFVNLEGKMNKIFLENSIITSEVTGKYYFNGSCYEDNPVYVAGNTCPSGQHDLNFILSNMGSDDQCEYYLNGTYTATAGHWTWQSTLVPCDDAGGGGVGGTSSYSGGSGGTGSVTTSPVKNCKTCIAPYVPTPCEKVKDQFTNNPTLQDKLNTLSGLTSAATESGFYKVTNSNIIQNASVGTDGSVAMPLVPNGAKCTMLAHTHNSPASNTYSIFSFHDLGAIAKSIILNEIDTNNFVAFLATADGTYYAFTIENPTAFSQFFANPTHPNFNLDIAKRRTEQMDLYYNITNNPDITPLIQENSSDYLLDQKAFLSFIQNNNLGASLLESNSTFTTFTKVTYDKGTDTINPQPCN